MTKPSPAPWKIQDQQIIAADESAVCEIYDATETDIANAKLIAAAPEIFKALEEVSVCLREKSMASGFSEISRFVSETIARARGDA